MAITLAEVDQAEAAFLDAKRKAQAKSATGQAKGDYKKQAADFAKLRSAYRLQEETAGRRAGIVGGDASKDAV